MTKLSIILLITSLSICYCLSLPVTEEEEEEKANEKVTEKLKLVGNDHSSVIKILPANVKPLTRKPTKLPDNTIYDYSYTWEDKEHQRSGDGFMAIPSWFYSFHETDTGYSFKIMKDATTVLIMPNKLKGPAAG